MLALATVFVAATAGAGIPGSAPAPVSDFAMKAARSGHAEVALGKLAQSRSTNAGLRAAARKIELDHNSAGDELKKVAAGKHWALPGDADLGAEGSDAFKHLKTLKGAEFDTAWIEHMINDHEKDVALFVAETKSSDAEIRAFAERTLPVIQSHLEMVRRLKELLG